MIFIKENVERIYEKLSKIASAKERKTNKKQYLLTQPFEDCLSEREREREREQKLFANSNNRYNNEREQKLKSAKAFW